MHYLINKNINCHFDSQMKQFNRRCGLPARARLAAGEVYGQQYYGQQHYGQQHYGQQHYGQQHYTTIVSKIKRTKIEYLISGNGERSL